MGCGGGDGGLISKLCPTLVTPWTVARQVPLPMGFSRQEYWSGVPLLPAGDLPNPEIEPVSLASPALAGGFFPIVPPGKPHRYNQLCGACSYLRGNNI